MARKFTAQQVAAILTKAAKAKGRPFILELVQNRDFKDRYHVRCKGRNGEIIMHGETLRTKQSARNIAARLIDGGLKAKFKDCTTQTPKKKISITGQAARKYQVGNE
jgi:uncharacterized protein YegP (UPF0339 family)